MLDELSGPTSETETDEAEADAEETDGLETAAATDQADDAGRELEDLEHEGRTYQVPKALKGAFLRQADYTRKTQELAGERRALEAERAVDASAMEARAGLASIERQLAAADEIDWDRFQAEDPEAAWAARSHLEQLAAAHLALAQDLADYEDHRQASAAHEQLVRLEAGHQELARDLPGWSPAMAQRLTDFAMGEFGVTAEELEAVHDPRLVKLLHAAYTAANREAVSPGAQRHLRAQASRPAASLAGRGGGTRDPNRMSTEEWMRHRNKQLRDGR